MLHSFVQMEENHARGRYYRLLKILYVAFDILIVLLVARAVFVMVPTFTHPIGDFIITITDTLVRPFGGLFPPVTVNNIVVFWDVIVAIVFYDIAITVFLWIFKKIVKIS